MAVCNPDKPIPLTRDAAQVFLSAPGARVDWVSDDELTFDLCGVRFRIDEAAAQARLDESRNMTN